MFSLSIQPDYVEISHKRIEAPNKELYWNHFHHHCEILVFINGDADYNIDGKMYSPKPYDVLLIPSSSYHYLMPKSSTPYENYVFGFDPSVLTKEQYRKIFSSSGSVNVENDKIFLGFLENLDYSYENYSERDFNKIAPTIIQQIVTYLTYFSKNEEQFTAVHPIVNEIIRIINRDIILPVNAESISRELMLSKSYIQNIFTRYMHIGVKQYILQKKLYLARKDLSGGVLSATQVCEKYSFSDYPSFYRLYKKCFGHAPCKTRSENISNRNIQK